MRSRADPAPSGEWVTLAARASDIGNGAVVRTVADGGAILVARSGDVFYAYMATCPACATVMDGATLDGAALVCDRCSAKFDIRRAGAGIGSDNRIEPLPLLEDSGVLRVAMLSPVS